MSTKTVRFDVEPKAGLPQITSSKKRKDEMPSPVKIIKDKWELLPAFVRAKGFVKQHIDSYNYFITTEIKEIVTSESTRLIRSDFDPRFFVEFLDCRIGHPIMDDGMVKRQLNPMACRLMDATYSAPILVDVDVYMGEHRGVSRRRNVEIGRMPVMLKSTRCVLANKTFDELPKFGECPQDPGGYFVVKGTEKVILMQEQLSKNRIITEHDFKKCLCATVSSASTETKSRTQVVLKNSKLYVRHNSFTDDIPVCVMLKAMGMCTDQEILQMIGTESHHAENVQLSMQEAVLANIQTQKQALYFVGRKLRPKLYGPKPEEGSRNESSIIDEAVDSIHRVILSHITDTKANDFRSKAKFICLMVRRVLDAIIDSSQLDDKDYYGNKRLELAGQLMSLMFEDKFKQFHLKMTQLANEALKKHQQTKSTQSSRSAGMLGGSGSYPDTFHNPPKDIITKGLTQALTTGNWTIKRFRMEKSGVAQVLSRFSYISSLGMMTRMVSGVEKGMKMARPRWLQPSQWGMVCPCDTPEGEGIGLVKNLSLMAQVTTDVDPLPLRRLCFNLGVEDASTLTGGELHDRATFLVFLNGTLLGAHRRPQQFLHNIRSLRRTGRIGGYVSIYDNEAHSAIYICTDAGRLCRPLIIVENGIPRLTREHIERLKAGELNFFDFLRNSVLEWVDVNEENNLIIAMKEETITLQTTHLEIDPLTIMGVVSGLVPYPHHNQSPRNTYQCAMGKQGMGATCFNQFSRCDNILYLLVYPMRPLCKTKTIELSGCERLPAGVAASVAVMSYSGYDIEDALIMNKGALDRGFQRGLVMKRVKQEMARYGGVTDVALPPPPPVVRGTGRNSKPVQHRRFEVLGEDGVANVGELLAEDQIYLNKHVPINTEATDFGDNNRINLAAFRPTPVKYKLPIPCYVDRVIVTDDEKNARVYKFMFRQTRRPELGDKFSSRHGQKGVCGCIVPSEDFPFGESGWTPDMIMNPHGFPSRMTIGKMLELLAGKSAVLDGKLKYGTAFGGTKLEEIAHVLTSKGFHYSGKDFLSSGITGEALQTYVFSGPIFYQRLKHMVQDKIHARGIGPRQLLTRQPTEGRAKMGGLRLGEMERDCLVAYGGANLILERLLLSSDAFNTFACTTCGLLGYNGFCSYCKSKQNSVKITIPYACKLLFQELMSMNVCPKLKLTSKI